MLFKIYVFKETSSPLPTQVNELTLETIHFWLSLLLCEGLKVVATKGIAEWQHDR